MTKPLRRRRRANSRCSLAASEPQSGRPWPQPMNGIQDDTLLQELVRDTIHRWRWASSPMPIVCSSGILSWPRIRAWRSTSFTRSIACGMSRAIRSCPARFASGFRTMSSRCRRCSTSTKRSNKGSRPNRPGRKWVIRSTATSWSRPSAAAHWPACSWRGKRPSASGWLSSRSRGTAAGEAHLLGKAAHPGIVPILSVTHDESTGWTVICMPLLGTATGTELLKSAFADGRTPNSALVIARVAAQLLPEGVSVERAAEPARRLVRNLLRRRRALGPATGRRTGSRPRRRHHAPRYQAFQRAVVVVRPADAVGL